MNGGRGHGTIAAALLLLPLLTVAACAGPHAARTARSAAADPADDLALFAAVVERLVAGARGVPVRVDPRPLRADPAIVELTPGVALAAPDLVSAAPEPLAAVPASALRGRREVLARLRVAPVDAFAHGDCPGILVPPELQGSLPRRDGCPERAFVDAIVGLPRPGGAYWPGGAVDERARAADGVWSVRVLRRHLRPEGVSAAAEDYVVRRGSGGGWTVLTVVPLLVKE